MVALAAEHGARAHGFTPAFYDEDRLTAMTDTVLRYLHWPPPWFVEAGGEDG
jgi:hypothetical protein